MCDYEYHSRQIGKKCPHQDYVSLMVDGEKKKYCLFHSPVDKRDADRFWKAFFKLIENYKIKKFQKNKSPVLDFEGFVFPDTGGRFVGYQFPKDIRVNFSETQFSGDANFLTATFSGDAYFSEATFSGNAYFSGATFSGLTDFCEATFSEGANFSGATFSGQADFLTVTFSGKAGFLNATFSGNVDFFMATFAQEASFLHAAFSGKAYFYGATFPRGVFFSWATFSEAASFSGVTFSEVANFSQAQFSKETNFKEAHFSGYAMFSKVLFCGEINFKDAQFSKVANFYMAEFYGIPRFTGAQFSGEAVYRMAKFFDVADFRWIQFLGKVVFNSAIILRGLSFEYTRFSQVISFIDAKLGLVADFSSADLHSQVDFRGADISSLNFSGAVFRIPPYFGDIGTTAKVICIKNFVGELTLGFKRGWSELYIDESDIKNKTIKQKKGEKRFELVIEGGSIAGVFSAHAPLKKIDLRDVTFKSTVNLHPNSKDKPALNASSVNFLGDVSISDVKVKEFKECSIASNFRLADSDLSRAKFSSVDLSRIDFVNCNWATILRHRSSIFLLTPFFGMFRRFFKRSRALYRRTSSLYNEITLGYGEGTNESADGLYLAPNLKKKDEDDKNVLEEMYRQVASSYEGHRRFGLAGHFKAGEFEVRRQRKETSSLEHFILAFYRWISFYGEEVVKPFLLLLSLPFVSAFLFLWLADGWRLSWEAFHNLNFDGFGIWFADFSKALTCGLQGLIPAFNYPADYPKLLSTIIGLLEKLFAALFTSLFLFALRRRVKR